MGDELGEFGNRCVKIAALVLELGELLAAALDSAAALFDAAILEIVEINQFANFAEAETDIARSHDPCQPRAVALAIDPRSAGARRRDQPGLFIETQGARGDAEFGREIGNRELLARQRIGPVEMGPISKARGGLHRHAGLLLYLYVNVNHSIG